MFKRSFVWCCLRTEPGSDKDAVAPFMQEKDATPALIAIRKFNSSPQGKPSQLKHILIYTPSHSRHSSSPLSQRLVLMSKLKTTIVEGLDFWRMTQGKIVEGVFGMFTKNTHES